MYYKIGLSVAEHNIHPAGINCLLVTAGFRFTLHIVYRKSKHTPGCKLLYVHRN